MKPIINLEAECIGYTARVCENPGQLFGSYTYIWRPTARWAIRAAQRFRDRLEGDNPRQEWAEEVLKEMEE